MSATEESLTADHTTVRVDPIDLRLAAGKLDILFDDTNVALNRTDTTDLGVHVWQGDATTGFGRFADHLAEHRDALLGALAFLSGALTHAADEYERQDDATATNIASVADRA